MKLVSKIAAFFNRVNSFFAFWAMALLVFLVLSISADAILRYFLKQPQVWVSEVSELCLPLITFLGTAWALNRDAHVKMDMLINRLRPEPRDVVSIITSTIGVVVSLFFVWYGAKVTWEHFQVGYFTSLLRIPLTPFLAVIPLGGFLLLIQFLLRIFECLRRLKWSSVDK